MFIKHTGDFVKSGTCPSRHFSIHSQHRALREHLVHQDTESDVHSTISNFFEEFIFKKSEEFTFHFKMRESLE